VLGATLGAAWGAVRALDEQGITVLTVPAAQVAVILGAAGMAGVLAATGPARRAAGLDVLDAIASQ
jgi:putative ABC transport system permease protein